MPRCSALLIHTSAFTLLTFALLAFSGCGGVSNNMAKGPTPTPTPMPGATPTPTPAAPADTYVATMFGIGKTVASVGQVMVDTAADNGSGNIRLNGAGLTATETLQFCPAGGSFNNCFGIATTAGTGVTNFQFPNKGAFAGVFAVLDMGQQVAVGGFGNIAGVNFQSALLQAASITGGIGQAAGNAPLTSGSAVATGPALHLILNGTTPSHSFTVLSCGVFGGSSCTGVGTVTTDASGNLSADVPGASAAVGAVFVLSDSAGAEFITGFRVM
jgi:hypothetical protein